MDCVRDGGEGIRRRCFPLDQEIFQASVLKVKTALFKSSTYIGFIKFYHLLLRSQVSLLLFQGQLNHISPTTLHHFKPSHFQHHDSELL
jgi:hypothetical protein